MPTETLNSYTVAQLKSWLRVLGKSTAGNKSELIQRLSEIPNNLRGDPLLMDAPVAQEISGAGVPNKGIHVESMPAEPEMLVQSVAAEAHFEECAMNIQNEISTNDDMQSAVGSDADSNLNDERQADERNTDERQAIEWQADERQADEQQSNERQTDERQVIEWQADERQSNERKTDERAANDENNKSAEINLRRANSDELNLMKKELMLIKREAELQMKENELLKRENELLKKEMKIVEKKSVTIPIGNKNNFMCAKDFVAEFAGTGDCFNHWKSQLKSVEAAFDFDESNMRALISNKLKGKALEWLHSKADLMSIPIDELLSEMQAIFEDRSSRLVLKRQFEDRKWQCSESFQEYFHEKIILANKIKVEEDDILEHLIEGIPSYTLRTQAKMHRFRDKKQLLDAFSGVQLEPMKPKPMTEKRRENPEDRKISTRVVRCYNCNAIGHMAGECRKPRREIGACHVCGEMGHFAADCPKKRTRKVHNVEGAEMTEEDERYHTDHVRGYGDDYGR